MDLIRRRESWPWIALLVGLLAMLPGLVTRSVVEMSNDGYEITMPDAEIVDLIHSGLSEQEVYGALRNAGLRSAAVEMQTVGDLEDAGRIVILDRGELLALQLMTGEDASTLAERDGTYVALVDDDTTILDRITTAQPTSTIEPIRLSNRDFYLVSGIPDLEDVAIGWDDARIRTLLERGLEVIARVPAAVSSPEFLQAELDRVAGEFDIDRVLFTGDATPFVGSPDADVDLARWLGTHGFDLITIEFTVQEGIETYIGAIHDVIRLHPLDLSTRPDPETSIGQGIRAVKERNIRILFIRPTTTLGAEARLEQLSLVIGGIRDGIPPWFEPGRAEPFADLAPTPLHTLGGIVAASAIGAVAGGFVGPIYAIVGAALLGLLGLAAALTGIYGIVADVHRLVVAVAFSVVAVAVARPRPRLGPATLQYVKAFLVVLAGGLTVTGLAQANDFLVATQDFFGVKALLVAPPAIVAAVAAYVSLERPRWSDTIPTLGIPLRIWHVAALGVAGALLWYLLLRSDNTGAASELELLFRQELEDVLYVRPRIKEFLFGFPALLVGILLAARTRHGWWLYAAAAVGTASAVDTFTHFHSPLLVSLLRTTLAVVIGYLVGLLGLGVLALGERGMRRLGILPRR